MHPYAPGWLPLPESGVCGVELLVLLTPTPTPWEPGPLSDAVS